MSKEYSLVFPDIDPGRGRTRELIEELASAWRDGRNEGAGEISAAVDFMRSDHLSDVAWMYGKGGVIERLALDFVDFLTHGLNKDSSFLQRFAADKGLDILPLNLSCVSSATAAIYLALRAARATDGEVITTSLNYVGVPNAIVMAGATPRFVDIDEKSWCMDPESAAKAINKNTKAIVITHINRCIDMEPFYDILVRKGLDIPVIQDASLAIGSTHDGIRPGLINLGSLGVTVFSLAFSKIVTGFGGALVTSIDKGMVQRITCMSRQGLHLQIPGQLEEFGGNFKPAAIQMVMAMESLKRSDEMFRRRRALKDIFDAGLAKLVRRNKIKLQKVGDETVMTHYGLLVPDREKLVRTLYNRHKIIPGIWHFHHEQALYRRLLGKKIRKLPVTEAISPKLVFLPFHTRLTDDDVGFICKALEKEMK